MDPSQEKTQEPHTPVPRKHGFLFILLMLVIICAMSWGCLYFFFPYTFQAITNQVEFNATDAQKTISKEESNVDSTSFKNKTGITNTTGSFTTRPEEDVHSEGIDESDLFPPSTTQITETKAFLKVPDITSAPTDVQEEQEKTQKTLHTCDNQVNQLDAFYAYLDRQSYLSAYSISSSSQTHFTELTKKLLANPPQISGESNDLYTILKNTAHFFRILGKDNILMMKNILDSEKGRFEQILENYFILVTHPECSKTRYGDINKDAIYEYACFFLNTMGGRLYLFRRDSLSRMVVTYYAILLVDLANDQSRNHHGISLGPPVDMLISEMETGGSSLEGTAIYLDTLYDLKEKYQ